MIPFRTRNAVRPVRSGWFVAVAVGCAGLCGGCPRYEPRELPVPRNAGVTAPVVDWGQAMTRVIAGETRVLEAADYAVSADELRSLDDRCSALETLELDNSNISSAQLTETLARLPSLKRLKLTGPVGNTELRSIARIGTLEILNLPQGRFDDKALLSLSDHAALRLLRFHSPGVGDEGLAVVKRLPSLRFLHVIDVPISDAGLEHLGAPSALESFYLDGGNCTDEGLSRLIKRLPKLHFHWNQLHLAEDPRAHPHD